MKKFLVIVLGLLAGLMIVMGFGYRFLFGAPQSGAEQQLFTIPSGHTEVGTVAARLQEAGLIRNASAFQLIWGIKKLPIQAGGYQLSPGQNAWQVAQRLQQKPDLVWITIPEGLRKEEIGNRMAETLGWSKQALADWNTKYTAMDYDHLEGTYYPDTYLIPVGENGLEVAKRMQRRFDEVFSPYMDEFLAENVKWTTAVRMASLVQREAAGKADMPLIAGIIWNRLEKNMNLEIDATVQYARDSQQNLTSGFWKPLQSGDTALDSKYNTYKYAGLPPFPICNPGKDAIEAVLHPAQTDCLYYLHDQNRQIHCAVTYEEHQANIEQYLKN